MLVIYSVSKTAFFTGWLAGWLYFPQHFCGVKLGYLLNLWPFCSPLLVFTPLMDGNIISVPFAAGGLLFLFLF